MASLPEQFEAAKAKVLTLAEKPSNIVMLELYGLNKQATIGDVNTEAPALFDFVAAAKHNAWKSKAGMPKDEAMERYIELVEGLFKK